MNLRLESDDVLVLESREDATELFDDERAGPLRAAAFPLEEEGAVRGLFEASQLRRLEDLRVDQ